MARFDRAGRVLLGIGLFSITAVVVYFWMSRLGSDLTWDESFNFRVYARHPLTAIGLYHEHNNHPLESFLKSIFYWAFGLDEPNVLRITGFLLVVAYVALGWATFRRLFSGGAVVSATVLALTLLLGRAFNYRAMELRGYFLSIALQWLYFFVLFRETGLLRREGADGALPAAAAWTRRTAVRYGFLSALIAFTLPSNVLVLPAAWVLTVMAFREAGPPAGGRPVRRFVGLALASAAFSALLYAPIVIGLLTGLSRFHNPEARPVGDAAAAMLAELELAVWHLAPRGLPEGWEPWVFLGLLGIGIAAAAGLRRRLARIALCVAATALVVRTAFASVVDYPERVRTALVPPLAASAFLIVHDLTAGWKPRAQLAASLLLLAASFCAVPSLVAEEGMHRVPSEIATFVEMLGRPQSRDVLVVHSNLAHPLYTLERLLGRDHIVASYDEMDSRFRGVEPAVLHPQGTWRRRLRDLILPEDRAAAIDPSGIEVLVMIDDESEGGRRASQWDHPLLERIKARLSRRSEFQRDRYRLFVFEAP